MTFSLDLQQLSGELEASGEIVIGGFRETFVAPLVYWNVEDYRSSWSLAAKRLLKGEARSAFVTSIHDPNESKYLTWWPAYRIDGRIVFHQQLLFFEQMPRAFEVVRLFELVPEYTRVSEDERVELSEWKVSLDDLAAFVARQH